MNKEPWAADLKQAVSDRAATGQPDFDAVYRSAPPVRPRALWPWLAGPVTLVAAAALALFTVSEDRSLFVRENLALGAQLLPLNPALFEQLEEPDADGGFAADLLTPLDGSI